MATAEIPLFPLNTVLFPGGHLPLRIFEQRYLTMIRDCASTDSGFGVCLIVAGEETSVTVQTAPFGTLARIVDWYTLRDGLLGVAASGARRFRLQHSRKRDDGLLMGTVEWLAEPEPQPLPEAFFVLGQVLGRFMEKLAPLYPQYTPDLLDNAVWVGYRLAELLPLSVSDKQSLVELGDPIERLQLLLQILPGLQQD
jgi:Lon protease-like protein